MGREAASVGNLVICEVHYNPDGDDDYEFIEFASVSGNRIDLGWANVAGEDGYRVERSDDGANFALIASPQTDATSGSQ